MMNATISLDSLWAIIDSLSAKNKKWLAERLNTSLSEPKSVHKEEILYGIAQSVKQAKAGETQPIDTLWEQL